MSYIIIYRENVALKSQVWGSLTLAQLSSCDLPYNIVDQKCISYTHTSRSFPHCVIIPRVLTCTYMYMHVRYVVATYLHVTARV